MASKTLRDLFVDELKDAYDAEKRLTKALPLMVKAADSRELSTAFSHHLEETKEHVTRLENVLDSIGETPGRKTCKAMVGLLEEGKELMEEEGSPGLKDAALIAAAQKVEHYEIATYGCLRAWAEELGESRAVELLKKTLKEESAADEKLSQIAPALNAQANSDEETDFEMADGSRTKSAATKKATSQRTRTR